MQGMRPAFLMPKRGGTSGDHFWILGNLTQRCNDFSSYSIKGLLNIRSLKDVTKLEYDNLFRTINRQTYKHVCILWRLVLEYWNLPIRMTVS